MPFIPSLSLSFETVSAVQNLGQVARRAHQRRAHGSATALQYPRNGEALLESAQG